MSVFNLLIISKPVTEVLIPAVLIWFYVRGGINRFN